MLEQNGRQSALLSDTERARPTAAVAIDLEAIVV